AGHAYSGGDNCADVRDTIDGYFDPSWTTGAAEQAVYAAWGSIVYQNHSLFVAHYFAGTRDQPCAYVTGQYQGWMAQWGTQNCALDGMLWPDIVDTFYSTDSTPTGEGRETTVNGPRYGTWHRYTLDPTPHGIVHVFVRASVVSAVPIDMDRWKLTAPYGGP